MNQYPPGTNRQTFKEIQRMPPIKLSEWLLTYGDYWLNEGAHAQMGHLQGSPSQAVRIRAQSP